MPRILHIANWYPNPWDEIEGNFVRDHIKVFNEVSEGTTIVVQVRQQDGVLLNWKRLKLNPGVWGYFLFTRFSPGKITEAMTALLLLFALFRSRVWRFDVLHFHIAYPLLALVRWWHWLVRKPVLITEHWTAYHFNFNLPENAKGLHGLRRPFERGFPVLAVSQALLNDIRKFARRDDFPGYVIPNVVPLHGAHNNRNPAPVLFSVMRWVPRKNPMPMLEGLARAAAAGEHFELVLGGFGEMIEPMKAFVAQSELAGRTRFLGKMTKQQIARQLATSDGYLFNSNYETFSVACAEALGAGVPLIGPPLSAIAEYAGPDDWQQVETRDAKGWEEAVRSFLSKYHRAEFDSKAIAKRAEDHFAPMVLRAGYAAVLDEALLVYEVNRAEK